MSKKPQQTSASCLQKHNSLTNKLIWLTLKDIGQVEITNSLTITESFSACSFNRPVPRISEWKLILASLFKVLPSIFNNVVLEGKGGASFFSSHTASVLKSNSSKPHMQNSSHDLQQLLLKIENTFIRFDTEVSHELQQRAVYGSRSD